MNILITGGSGYLGKHLTKVLKNDSTNSVISLSSKDVDLKVSGALDKFNYIKFDKIYHLASWSQAGDFSLYHSGEQWIYNQLINSNTLDWWFKSQKQAKIISIGTNLAYEEGGLLEENNYMKGQPLESYYAYAMTKRMLLIGQKALAKQFGLKYFTVIPPTLYGQGYEVDDKVPHFIFDIIVKILKKKFFNIPFELWGDGTQKRELIHVNDFINQMILLEDKCENEIINLGAEQDYEIKYFVKIICKLIDFNFNDVYFNKNKFVGPKSKKLSIKKLKNLLPHYKSVSLSDGLLETINDLKKKIQ